MSEALRERVRERLEYLAALHLMNFNRQGQTQLINAILREFRLQPVAVGKVTGEGEVEGL